MRIFLSVSSNGSNLIRLPHSYLARKSRALSVSSNGSNLMRHSVGNHTPCTASLSVSSNGSNLMRHRVELHQMYDHESFSILKRIEPHATLPLLFSLFH